jgi:antitoxin HicB
VTQRKSIKAVPRDSTQVNIAFYSDKIALDGAEGKTTFNDCAIAIKRVLARQLAEEMKLKKITKTEMAIKMQTSRAQLDRLLDPEKTGVSIDTIQRAASVVGRQLQIELI